MKRLLFIVGILGGLCLHSWGQVVNPNNPPNDCPEAVPGCTNPSFPIVPPNSSTNNYDFGTGTFSNPSTNPNSSPGNAGCLLTGETSSTFITIYVTSNGTLEWSIGGTGGGCFDWIMWPYTNAQTTCPQIASDQLAPVSCNWNGNCNGLTGMAAPANIPSGGFQSNFENPLNVTAGQSFLLCLSNFSSTNQSVNLNFFGTANVACGVAAPDQTICNGSSTTVTIATPGYTSPSFEWLVTNGVSNTSGGTNVVVTPTVTTTYAVKVSQLPGIGQSAMIDTAYFTITVVDPPQPNAGPDQTVCFGTPIQLNGTITYPTDAKSWNFFNLNIVPTPSVSFSPNFSSLNPTVTVDQPGTYGFVLRETNPTCGIRRDTVMVTVKKMDVSETLQHPSCAANADGSISLTGTGAVQYSFDGGNTYVNNATMNNLAAGTYNVCTKDNLGCMACKNVTLVAPPPIDLTLSNDTIICQNGTATVLAQSSSSGMFYTWSHTSNTSGLQNISPTVAQWYYVQGTHGTTGCQTSLDSVYVDLYPPISGVQTPSASACPGYPVTLDASATGGIGAPYTFSWSNSQTQSGSQASTTYIPQGTGNLILTVTDACESSPFVISSPITVHPVPQPSFTVDTTMKCEPAPFELVITSPSSSYVSSEWNIHNFDPVPNQDTVLTPRLRAGQYNVQLILTNTEGCIDSVTYTQYLRPQKLPDARFLFTPAMPSMFNTKVSFENISSDATDFIWRMPGGTPNVSTLENAQTIYPDGIVDKYPVELVAISNFGCRDSISEIVEIISEVILFTPNSFTPDNDQHNPVWRPVIEGIDLLEYELVVYNRWGEMIWKTQDKEIGWDGTVNNRPAPSDIYMWSVKAKGLLDRKPYIFNGSLNLMR